MRLLPLFLTSVIVFIFVNHSRSQHAPLKAEWSFATNAPLYSGPVADGSTVYVTSTDSFAYALTLNGKLLWKLHTGGPIRSTPTLTTEAIVFISGDGIVYSADKTTGKVVWKFKTLGEKQYELFSFADYYQSTALVRNDTLYIGSGDGHMYCLDAKTGTLIWKFKTAAVVHCKAAIDHETLYFGSFDGFFYALDAKTGTERWRFKSVGQKYFPKGEMQGSPIIVDNIVIVGSRDYNLYGIDKTQGYCHWNRRFVRGWAIGHPVLNDSVVYIGTSDDQEMHAIDPATGHTTWKLKAGFNIFGGMAVAGNTGYFGTLMGKLFMTDLSTGSVLTSFTTHGYQTNRLKYFKADDSYRDDLFTSVLKRNEDFLKLYEDVGAIFSTPVIHDRYIFVTSMDGRLYCIRRPLP
jgi:outer membrane protein assembly factor BamB